MLDRLYIGMKALLLPVNLLEDEVRCMLSPFPYASYPQGAFRRCPKCSVHWAGLLLGDCNAKASGSGCILVANLACTPGTTPIIALNCYR